MKALADLLIAAADLVEAEGRALRREGFRLGASLALLLLAALLGAAGMALLGAGLFFWLAQGIGREFAAIICGLAGVLIAGIIWWQAQRLIH